MSNGAKMSGGARSQPEIEDVLSSIRRLVSEHHPGERPEAERPVATAVAPEQPAASADNKLVLTPSLRVQELDDPWAPVPTRAPEQDSAVPEDRQSTDTAAHAAAQPPLPSWMTNAPHAPKFNPDDRLQAWADAAAETDTETGFEDEPPAQPAAAAPAPAEAPTLPAPGEGAPADRPATDWSNTAAEDAQNRIAAARQAAASLAAKAQRQSSPAARSDAAAAEDAAEAPEARPEAPAQDMPMDTQITGAPMQAAAEAAAPARQDQSEAPDEAVTGSLQDALQDRMQEQEQEQEQEQDNIAAAEVETDTAGPAQDVEDLGDAESPFSFPSPEDSILDEETLREIIAEVVREELQGTLGQHITRNVRKMVRREIRLALAVEDLD